MNMLWNSENIMEIKNGSHKHLMTPENTTALKKR
jgi:hypothetical protein